MPYFYLKKMRIENELKLGFKDVMIRPKRSTLKSRSQVTLEREFKFLHSTIIWTGIPIMAANMDTVGTFEMAKAFSKYNLFTAIHKHYSLEEWRGFVSSASADILKNIAVSTGTGKKDSEKVNQILTEFPQINFICVDVANGYSEHFVNFVQEKAQKSS